MRRAKIYVTDVHEGDRISRTRDGEIERVFMPVRIIQGECEVRTTSGGTETTRMVPVTRMFWIEID